MNNSYDALKDKRVLVTGGGGFIGSHLVEELIRVGAKVYVMDLAAKPSWKLQEFSEDIQYFPCDIRSFDAVDKVIEASQPLFIYHLSAYGVDAKDQEINKAIDTNVKGMIHVVKSANKHSCKMVINVGTCAEYGNNKYPIDEQTVLKPMNTYGSTKACASLIGHQLARQYDLSMVTLRLFGVFGEREAMHKVFCQSITTLLKDEDLQLTSCMQERDYCYIKNIIDALLLIPCHSELKDEVFNIGMGEIYPLKYYIQLIRLLVGGEGKLLFGRINHRKNELWTPQPNTNKIRGFLDWEPRYSLEEGLKRTIDWYRNHMEYYQ